MFVTKPLLKQMMTYCELDPQEHKKFVDKSVLVHHILWFQAEHKVSKPKLGIWHKNCLRNKLSGIYF